MSGSAGRPMGVLAGLIRLARFRADGFDAFAATPQAFLNSLAPLLGFPIAGAVLLVLSGEAEEALHGLLASVVGLLAPPVLSHLLARMWGREAAWLRYAVAFNWCQWVLPVVAGGLALLIAPLLAAGVAPHVAAAALLVGLLGYGLALHLFLARRGLGLGRGRALLLVLGCNFGTFLLLMGPELLRGATA